jgi:hypothetical protein
MTTKISQKVQDLSTQLKDDFKVGEAGVIEVSADAVEKSLEGTGLTMELFEKTQAHRDDLVAASGLAIGELGLDAFNKNKSLAQVSVEMKVGKDVVGGVFARSKQVPDGQGGMQTKFGVLSSRVQVNGAANKGELKKVRSHLAELAKGVLAE